MSNQAKHIDILKKLQEKYDAQSEDTENYLEGLLYGKSLTYWDYIHTDALLSLQTQRFSKISKKRRFLTRLVVFSSRLPI